MLLNVNNNHKIRKIKIFCGILIIIMILIIINVLTINYIILNESEYVSGEEYHENSYIDYDDMLLSKNDYSEQYFKPQYSGLSLIKIRIVATNSDLLEQNNDYLVRFTLSDDNNKIIKTDEVHSSSISNWHYYNFDVNEDLSINKIYSIKMEQILGPDGQTNDYSLSFIPFLVSHEFIESRLPENIQYIKNSVEKDADWDNVYVYSFVNYKEIIILIISDLLLIIFICFVTYNIYYFKKWKVQWNKCITMICPILLFVLVEIITNNIMTIQWPYIILTVIIEYGLFLIILCICNSVKLTILLNCFIGGGTALIEYYVLRFRGSSVMLQDIFSINTAKSVLGAYRFNLHLPVGIALMSLVTLMYFIIILPDFIINKIILWKRITIILIGGVMIYILTNSRLVFNIRPFKLDMWDIEGNYKSKGLLITLLSQVQYIGEPEPKGYSVDSINNILDASLVDLELVSNIQPENLIVIMNESWADFNYIGPLNTNEEITPFINAISDNTIKGYVQMPVFGGGTSNSEFEVLTGNSLNLLNLTGSAYEIYVNDEQFGMASTLKSQGFYTIALHPHWSTNWSRNKVYEKMNFDKFISLENWDYESEYIRDYVSDQSSFEYIIDIYNSKPENDKLFVFLITMQNHGGYENKDFNSTVKLNYNEDYPDVSQYLSLLQKTDKAFEILVNYFKKIDEPTMIVMFGDHFPSVDKEFYKLLYTMDLNDRTIIDKQKMYMAPFIIWTNYEMESQYDIEMSANYFGSYIMDKAGLEMTQYNKYLLKLMEDIPVLGKGAIRDSDGKWYSMSKLPKRLGELINQYKVIEYNNMFDRKNKLNTIFSLP